MVIEKSREFFLPSVFFLFFFYSIWSLGTHKINKTTVAMTTEPHGWNGPQKHAKSGSPDASPAKHLLKKWVPIDSKNYTLSLYNEFKSRIDCFCWAISVPKLIKARDCLHLLVHKNFAVHPPFCSPSSYQFVHNTQSSWLQITIQTRTCGQLLILDLMVFVLASRL